MITGISLVIPSSILLVVSCYWIFGRKKAKNSSKPPLKRPPCLPWIPFVGSFPFLPSFAEMPKFFAVKPGEQNDVMGFYLMNEYYVILNTREAIHDAFVKRSIDFADRPKKIAPNRFLNPRNKGIFFHQYDEDFKKYRKLGLGILKQFGFGSKVMENRILDEVKMLLRNIEKFEEEEFNPDVLLLNYSMNVISRVLFGQRFDESDQRLTQIKEIITTSFEDVGKYRILDNVPFMRLMPSLKSILDKLMRSQIHLFSILNQEIIACMDSSDTGPNFIKSYINKEGPNYDKEQLLHFMRDLFLAGSQTTASTLAYVMIFVANHPIIQETMLKELNKVDLIDGMVTLESKRNLPFCEAVMCEIFRTKLAASLSVPHFVTKDTQILDYFIPSNTTVFANLYSAHHDDQLWGDPTNFRPERFIKENGFIDESKRDLLITFSLGKRSCLGEILAKQELFLSVTNLVRQFAISPPFGKHEIEFEDIIDITTKPSPFKVRVSKRR